MAKKIVRLTENDMSRLVRRIINEKNELDEYFGGGDGYVKINVEGEGKIKDIISNEIRYLIRNFGGDITLHVDGEKQGIFDRKDFRMLRGDD